MNLSNLLPLALRIEERETVLSASFNYSASTYKLDSDESAGNFSKAKPDHSPDNSVHRGKREFHKLLVITYCEHELQNFTDEMLQAEDSAMETSLEAFDEKCFLSGNPVVETTEGIIHVYKHCKLEETNERPKSEMLCIFAVPAYMTIRDLMLFTAPMRDSIEQLKVVKDGTPNQYMVLLKFKTDKDADVFYETYDHTNYNSMEAEVCQIVYVSHVEALTTAIGASFPIKGFVELPNCPVCLERLDEPVQGILTILCNHTFHGNCISKMTETFCPVCRYVQTPETMGESVCAVCELHENLWICLICGHVGCGRYGQKHAHKHFEETGHTFALELGKSLVWDYAEDAYVHRLVANKSDGKMVQVGDDTEDRKKVDALSYEFTELLTSQLESQRFHFESELSKLDLSHRQTIETIESRLDTTEVELGQVTSQLEELKKEKQSLEKKFNTTSQTLSKVQKQLSEELQMNECLRTNQSDWQTKLSKAESQYEREMTVRNQQIVELEEQLQDLMMNLEMRSKIQEVGHQENITDEDMAKSEVVLGDYQGGAQAPPMDAKQRLRARRKNRH